MGVQNSPEDFEMSDQEWEELVSSMNEQLSFDPCRMKEADEKKYLEELRALKKASETSTGSTVNTLYESAPI